jgi:O-acetyl-ADP-ribose deacetylase (regulator of RNase III)
MRGPLSFRVGCEWRSAAEPLNVGDIVAPAGFVRYRQQMAAAGAPVSFRLPSASNNVRTTQLFVRLGCIGAAATGGRFAAGGIVTSANPLLCGNRSLWWGFKRRRNVDGIVHAAAGPGLAAECDALPAVGPEGEKLLLGSVRATGAHELVAKSVLHALSPTSHRSPRGEGVLRQTYESCLRVADAHGLASLALPALGCGINAFPPAVSARAALDAVDHVLIAGAEAAACAPATTLLEFVLLDEQCYAAFADAAHARWGGGGGRRESGVVHS